MRYRRSKVNGGTYFFTVNLAERHQTLLIDQIDTLRAAINKAKKNHPFTIDAIVVLPDHIHAIWTLPKNDNEFSKRWGLIKSGFSYRLPKEERRSKSRVRKGERGIWQRRFWEHQIRDEKDFEMHIDYIHYNPVKHGYVKRAVDWPYSSIHEYVAKGILESHWGDQEDHCYDMVSGERL